MTKPFLYERVGVFGGCFDPIHNGHLINALDARHDLGLDRVLFVVAKEPWQKKDSQAELRTFDRLIMVDLAIAHLPWAEVCLAEIDREGPSYTIDTLIELSAPGRELFVIVGEDQVSNLTSWHRYKEIPDYGIVHPIHRWVGISSTQVRQRIQEGKSLDYIVPPQVIDYIENHRLYDGGSVPRTGSVPLHTDLTERRMHDDIR